MSSLRRSSEHRAGPDAGAPPLTVAEIEARLGVTLDAVLSSRRTAREASKSIAALTRAEQDFVLHWADVIARTSAELAFQFTVAAHEAIRTLGIEGAERWVLHAVDTYDREGLYRGTEAFRDARSYAAHTHDSGVAFEDAARILRLFVQGLEGRELPIEQAPRAYTDTERIYLPPCIERAGTPRENFLSYKATATILWAQSRYGTFNADLESEVAGFDDPKRALELLNALETRRLEARLEHVLPGLARDLRALRSDEELDPRLARLREDMASVHDSIVLLHELYAEAPALGSAYETALEPALAAAARAARIAREKAAFQAGLARIAEAQQEEISERAPAFALESVGREADGEPGYTLTLDGQPVAAPDELAQLIASIEQDLGEVPADYLSAAPESSRPVAAEIAGDPSAEPAHVYDEWDYQRGHYRKNWCEVREHDVQPGDGTFVEATANKYRGRIAQLKRTFELMRGEDRSLKRQPDGEDLDYDALIEAYVDMSQGEELAPLVFSQRRRAERDLAALFVVDMSGSTKGWINDAEREALVMLCEALEALGDRYAIYGFSGMTRRKCEVFRIKRFEESYGDTVRSRIAGIEAQDYTRMGAAIRHLTGVLNGIDARTRLLVTLSDGRPDDFSDNYRGEYGIEDTRQALLEAHRSGVKPFCITIDREARDYLPHMYGAVSWTLVQDVAKLPLKVAEIYARLTR
jgi:nitric oxide reductase NorD protein